MNPVVHFEMPALDRKRMADFYTRVFGWKTEFFGEEMGNYVTVMTTEADANGRPLKPGAINGGFYPTDAGSNEHPSVVIGVGDMHEAIGKIEKAGGKMITGPTEIPGVGQYASFLDTEGNKVSVLQPMM